MRNVTLRSLQATTVIAAVLALGSIPAFAQDASAPVIDSPPAASAPVEAPAPASAEAPSLTTAAPQIVVPVASAPVSQPVAQAPEAPAPKASVTHTERHATRAIAQTETKAPVRAAEAPVAATPVAPIAAAPASDAAKAAAIPPATRTVSDKDAFNSGSRVSTADQSVKPASLLPGDSGIVAGGIVVVLGLGAAALFASRRRKTAGEVYEPVEAVEPASAVVAEPAFVLEAPTPLVRTPAPVAMATSGPVPIGDAREDLLQSMVDAAPDAENPFTSGKARRRRARLILQAHEQHQREAEERFDFRKYQSPVRATGAEAHRIPSPVDA
jgi:hypothetical protein